MKLCRILLSISIIISVSGLSACQSQLFQTIFQEQEWSENYALEEGVQCTAMEMIDGDLITAGAAVFPERVQGRTVYGAFPSAEAEVKLPEKKSIHKIVIHSEDLESFKVLASTGDRDQWKLLKEFDNNSSKEIVIKTSVLTDKIRIVARGISSRGGDLQREVDRNAVRVLRSRTVAEPMIQEIELYGYK